MGWLISVTPVACSDPSGEEVGGLQRDIMLTLVLYPRLAAVACCGVERLPMYGISLVAVF